MVIRPVNARIAAVTDAKPDGSESAASDDADKNKASAKNVSDKEIGSAAKEAEAATDKAPVEPKQYAQKVGDAVAGRQKSRHARVVSDDVFVVSQPPAEEDAAALEGAQAPNFVFVD